MGECEVAQTYLAAAMASLREFDDMNINDYRKIKHWQLQEQLADLSVRTDQYEKAYQYIKMSIEFCQQQKYMLQVHFPLEFNDVIMVIKRSREEKKLELRKYVLEKKKKYIQKRMPVKSIDEEEQNIKKLLWTENYDSIDVIMVSGCLQNIYDPK